MVAAQKARLETAVTDGFLTTAQATQIESTMEQRVSAFVNGTRQRGFRGYGSSGASSARQTAGAAS